MKVFYSHRQSVANNNSYSPSAGKPALLVAQWLERWPEQIQLVEPEPARPEDFHLAHAPSMVEEILTCRRENGFSNRLPEVAQSLPWTTGSMVSAALQAASSRSIVCSPTSGFHHAGYEHCGGYCTFNGLIVAARRVGGSVAILDCDNHYGDGTDEILRKLKLRSIRHYTTGSMADRNRPEAFLESLPQILEELTEGGQARVLLYQAGADACIDDPLGGWMTVAQLRRRDRAVFGWCAERRLGVAWNLAGGYQRDIQRVLDIHHATMEEALELESAPVNGK